MSEEIFDVVDKRDCVISQAPRSEVHARGLLHRAIHVFVFNSRGELLIQKRSETKDEFPLTLTSSASGHLSAGETYDECAPREMQEEIGISSPLQFLEKFDACPELANEHSVLYRSLTDDEPNFDPEEIESIAFYSLDELTRMIERSPDRFAPPFLKLFAWYREQHAEV